MITLITGTPGAGKTLYALAYIKRFAEINNRKVYQSGISNLTLPWELFGKEGPNPDKPHETDAEEWYTLPKGSIIVIDECQRLYRPRGTGSRVPESVARLETHRHQGYDIFLITQHPMLIDSNIRRLVGQHFHVIRKHGMKLAKVCEWSSCTEVTPGTVQAAVRHDFKYPVDAFAWYKSAEVHTHKVRIPMRVWFLWTAPLLVAGLVWVAWGQLQKFKGRDSPTTSVLKDVAKAATPGPGAGAVAAVKAGIAKLTPEAYAAQFVPRFAGLPHSAPAYDELTKISRAPVPSSCVASKAKCLCYSQDVTVMSSISEDVCRAIVKNGYFANFSVGPSAIYVAPAQDNSGAVPRQSAAGAPVRAAEPEPMTLPGPQARARGAIAAAPVRAPSVSARPVMGGLRVHEPWAKGQPTS